MSSAVFSTSAAQGRPFVFDSDNGADCLQLSGAELFAEAHLPQRVVDTQAFNHPRFAGVTPASRLAVRPVPEMVSSGIAPMDALTGGLPRGCLTEICGPASSGRSTLMLAAIAAATQRGEFCAVVDASDALDPQSAAAAGIDLDRLLWVRCGENSPQRHGDTEKKNLKSKFDEDRSNSHDHRLEQLLRITDLLLESGGFGMIALDLGDLPPQTARRIPLATWFRFRRTVEHTSTVLLALERQSIAGSCSSLLIKLGLIKLASLKLSAPGNLASDVDSQFPTPTHAQLLSKLEITAELVRSRMERKPARSAEITFASKTAWAG